VEDAGSVCTFCPSQCNTTLTVRDERVMRVRARDHAEVDDGWLCDKGRFAYQSVHVDERVIEPMVRDGGQLRPVSWERALGEAARGLARAGAASAALAGGQATNEEGFLLARLLREVLGSPHVDSRRAGPLPLALQRALAAPALQARVSDLEFAHAVLVLDAEPLDDAPVLDLRLRKGVRRRGLKLAVATPQASALDAIAAQSLRCAPGGGAVLAQALLAALAGDGSAEQLARDAGAEARAVGELATFLRDAGEEIVIVWGERLGGGARALLDLAARLELGRTAGAGLLELPAFANGRGLREAGVLPNAGPGLSEPPAAGAGAGGVAELLAGGGLSALYLLQADPLRDLPGREQWQQALSSASTVVAHASFLDEGLAEFADVVFPAEAYPEKEGTIVHPDGRLQRLRPAIKRPGSVRAGWQVLADLARRLGSDLGVLTGPSASQQLFAAVPFYAGLTLEEIGGRGVRWQEREAASALPAAGEPLPPAPVPPATPRPGGPDAAERDGYRSVWDAPEVEHSPAFDFLQREEQLV
jgi:NADH-quinone oxidoreductase subunit G